MTDSPRPVRWRAVITSTALLLGLSLTLMSGCSGCNRPPQTTQQTQKTADPLEQARDLYHGANDAAKFRDANEQVNKYLASHSDALTRHQASGKERPLLQQYLAKRTGDDGAKLDDRALYRKFLEAVVGLDQGEIDEVESETLRLLDAHYLDGCYFLRDAARSMPLQGMSQLDQVEFCFSWLMRQILLQEGRDELLPPQFVLLRGQGSSRERMVVFAALVQQLDLDACVIAVAGNDGTPRPWLAGVLIPVKDRHEVYLFDCRLGLPVPGPQGAGIATLAQRIRLRLAPGTVVEPVGRVTIRPGDVLPMLVERRD